MLWIALHLPLLSLEAFAATLPPAAQGQAVALMDVHHIVAANAAALALGVQPGQKRATALALAPQIILGHADAARDAQALTAVAHTALAWTPSVTIQPAALNASPHTVLLEVQASLRCFGGRERLQQGLLAALAPLGHRIHHVSAPTAQGAALLARARPQGHCADLPSLQRALDELPVWLLGPGREHWEALQGMGLRTLADLRRLPRAGLARRFDVALLDELDRALGRRPDPRESIVLPARFDSRLELHARADSTEQVLYGAGVLLTRMVAWLAARHAGVRRCTLAMRHETRWRADDRTPEETRLELALAEPSRDAAHLQVLLRERLAALQLPAPTLELRLHSQDIVHRPAPNSELFPSARSEREGITRLIERLQARLGREQVLRPLRRQDHRPELASALRPVAAGGVDATARSARASHADASPPVAMRPTWLLPCPEPLREHRSRPLLNGEPLQLLSGPERIEAGWWDAGLAERDYFIAQVQGGALVWIYRARLPLNAAPENQGWFLQGRFG